MTVRGLTLGKFAPLHHGHQHVIETALAEVDELVVLIYDAQDVTHVPLAVRAGWIRRLYPNVHVLEVRDGPHDVGADPDLMRRHEECILRVLAGRRIDRFYSSEFYGEHVSRALAAQDRRVDPERRRVSVCGTAVRSHPYRYRDRVDPVVYRDLIVNVALLGGPSTGKTTLARRLAELSTTCWMPEYGREVWEREQVDRRLTPAQLAHIADGHVRREDALLLEADRVLFTDTNAITTRLFALAYHGSVPTSVDEHADRCAERYDLTFVCGDEIPYTDSWDRSGAGERTWMQERTLEELRLRGIPHRILRGDLDARAATVRRVLGRFTKYGDPVRALRAEESA